MKFNYFGLELELNDAIGINAESLFELNDKLSWCRENGIYENCAYPVNGPTIHMILLTGLDILERK